LQQYQGSFVAVSHNRYFVSQVANKIWYIENQQIKEYPGTYEEYEYWVKNIKVDQAAENKKEEVKKPKSKPSSTPASLPPDEKLKTLEKDLKKVETIIEKLQQHRLACENELAKPEIYNDNDKVKEVQSEFDTIKHELEKANKKWEDIATQIDALEG
jgi:ATP-binding cassette subfamily F protein 3